MTLAHLDLQPLTSQSLPQMILFHPHESFPFNLTLKKESLSQYLPHRTWLTRLSLFLLEAPGSYFQHFDTQANLLSMLTQVVPFFSQKIPPGLL